MALVIDGDAGSFRAAAYGRPNEMTVNFLQQQFDNPSRALNLASSTFYERSRTAFDANYGDEAMARLEAVRRALRATWDEDVIRPLLTLGELQQAKPAMQRWIMANPFVRKMYKQGRVAGYNELYLDHKKQGIGPEHYDYRLAMSGYAQFDDENDWVATTYCDDLLPGDVRPTFAEQCDIERTWAAAEFEMMFGSKDPTSPENSDWG